MEPTIMGLYGGYIYICGLIKAYIGRMEKKMEPTIIM